MRQRLFVNGWTRREIFDVLAKYGCDGANTHKLHSKKGLQDIDSLASLERKMDVFRSSQNIFMGIQLDGVFDKFDLRAACKAAAGEDLVAATSHQGEFCLENVEGTLVGFWTPAYARILNVSGYHLHFISAD